MQNFRGEIKNLKQVSARKLKAINLFDVTFEIITASNKLAMNHGNGRN